MHHRLRLILALLVASVTSAAVGNTQQTPVQDDLVVDVVRLQVAVINPSGEEVPPLTADDFIVYDNGVRQEIQFLLQPAELPLHVALLIDHSPSVQPYQHSLQRAAISFLASLAVDDCPYVLPFSEQVGPGQWGRYASPYWDRYFREVRGGEGTSLFDAILIALEQIDLADEIAAARIGGTPQVDAPLRLDHELLRNPPADVTRDLLVAQIALIVEEIAETSLPTQVGNCSPRGLDDEAADTLGPAASKAILLLSDGSDTSSAANLDEMLVAARLASVPVFPVVIGPATRDAQMMARLTALARATGGLLIERRQPTDFTSAFHEVLDYAKSYYILAYDPDAVSQPEGRREPPEPNASDSSRGGNASPTNLGAWHSLKVELRRPLLKVISRPGYFR